MISALTNPLPRHSHFNHFYVYQNEVKDCFGSKNRANGLVVGAETLKC